MAKTNESGLKGPIIGAHVKSGGGLFNVFKNGEKIGADCIQIFGGPPLRFIAKEPSEEITKKYKAEQKRTGIGPVILHAPYLINLATPDKDLYEKSIKSLISHLKVAEKVHALGAVFHLGSYKNSNPDEAVKRQAKAILKVLKQVPGKSCVILENSSGGGKKLGSTPEEIGRIYEEINNLPENRHKSFAHPRVKICIDTCHLFSAGIMEKFTPKEIKNFKERCEKSFGLKNIIVIHANDSLTPFNENKDRHANIGEGKIGIKGFSNLARDDFFGKLPWYLEVPGFKGEGPDSKNIQILKNL